MVKCKLNCEIPAQWRKLTREEGQEVKNDLNKMLDQWSIVAFSNGKIDGAGYGNKIHTAYEG